MSDAAPLAAKSLMQLEQEIGRRPVGAVDDEAPAEPLGLGADFGAMACNSRLVILAPVLGPPARDIPGPFRLDEFDPPRVRKGPPGRVNDLYTCPSDPFAD